MNIRIAPSLLSADFSRLAEEIASVEAGADVLHLDVMDGHFVPNLTIGPAIVKACRKVSKLTFDCHLMIEEPQLYIERFLEAGADMISVHVETEPHLERALRMIRDGGAKAGIALNPATFEGRSPVEILATLVHEMVHLGVPRVTEKLKMVHNFSVTLGTPCWVRAY